MSCTGVAQTDLSTGGSLHAKAATALVQHLGVRLGQGIVSTTRPIHDPHSTDDAYRDRAEELAQSLDIPAMEWDEAFECRGLSEGCTLPEGKTFVLEPLPVQSEDREDRSVVLKYITTSPAPVTRMADAIAVYFYRIQFHFRDGEWVMQSVELFGRS